MIALPTLAKVAAVAVVAAGLVWAGMRLESANTERVRTELANYKAEGAQAALADLTVASRAIREVAERAASAEISLQAELNAIRKEVKKNAPLPVDCRPDADRVRQLEAAVDATNKTASGKSAR